MTPFPTALLPTSYIPQEYSGSAQECGLAYGTANAEAILSFILMETAPDEDRLAYAGQCSEVLQNWEPVIVDFARGMAKGCGRTLEEITLLLLHEEIIHTQNLVPPEDEHCTALGATGDGTQQGGLGGEPIIGMNWDWRTQLYAWPSLLRLNLEGAPRVLTYSFPGLWAGAGINETGMALVWTGAGYLPPVKPLVGVPTYALIAGVLSRSSCREAIKLIESTRLAGCFVFFLADEAGEVWVVEGGAGQTRSTQCRDVIGRANHYETEELCAASQQQLVPDNTQITTCGRARRMQELLQEHNGRIDGEKATAILCDHNATAMGQGICQHPRLDFSSMTLDSIYLLPQQRELWIARGLPCRHQYQRHTA